MKFVATLKTDDLNDLLQNPDDWLFEDDDDCLLITFVHTDCTYQIFAGCDEHGYYLYIEDDDHCMYVYDQEDGKSLTEIYEELFNIARNQTDF